MRYEALLSVVALGLLVAACAFDLYELMSYGDEADALSGVAPAHDRTRRNG